MRLIFSPNARVRERSPSRVGFGSGGGPSAATVAGAFLGATGTTSAAALAAVFAEGCAAVPFFAEFTVTVSLTTTGELAAGFSAETLETAAGRAFATATGAGAGTFVADATGFA